MSTNGLDRFNGINISRQQPVRVLTYERRPWWRRHLDGLRVAFWTVVGIAFVGGLWYFVILPSMADSWFGQ